ncbi:cation:proton antiporter [Hominilimicola sp.]|uniref:cation:proton antiporter n=1 Tax=Hominilimicola sp. TaxID=3073571 RepID=UPI00307C417E
MESYKYLLDIALILISTKILGLLTRRIQLPQVVGALIAGLLLGPACFGVLQETDFIKNIAEIGVIVLMFAAGLETDVQELKKTGLASFIIALLGVIVPLIGGYFVATIYNPVTDQQTMLQNIFVGVVLTATSVSITVETLKELGKLSTKTGNAILGAALIDDVLGIIALTVISSFAGSDVSLWVILLKILGFFIFCGVVAFLFIKFVNPWINKYQKDLRRFVILAFAFCLLMSFSAEYFFGVSDITGAFVAGLILSNNKKTSYMLNRFDTVSYVLLSPVFFASVGLKVTFSNMSATVVVLTVLLLVVAILSKMIGCGLGAKICKYTNLQSVKIGIGMISRGEVALIVATKGMSMGLMKDEFFAPLVLVVVATTIVTPILLKLAYKYQASREADVPMASSLVDKVEERNDLEKITQNAANMHEEMKEIHK